MNKIGFIVNGRKSIVKSFQKSFNKYSGQISGEYNVLITSEKRQAISLARELSNDAYSHVIAVGGDGTLHEVVNGLMQSDNADCTVGLLPSGTANDYAKSIGAKNGFAHLVEKLHSAPKSKVNVGRISLADGSDEYFINIADMGLGVDVVHRINKSNRWFGADLTFSKAILQSFISYKNQQISVIGENWSWEGKINSLVIANGSYFGSGMCIAPDASLESNHFSVVIIGDISIKDYLKYLGRIKKGKRIDHPEVRYEHAKVVNVQSYNLGIEADGEFVGINPERIELLKGGLNFLV